MLLAEFGCHCGGRYALQGLQAQGHLIGESKMTIKGKKSAENLCLIVDGLNSLFWRGEREGPPQKKTLARDMGTSSTVK